jgi:hypothetical protein
VTPPLSASAWADGPDAVGRAVAAATAGLDGGAPSLVLVFPDTELPGREALKQAAAVVPGCPFAGMTSNGLITRDGVRSGGCAATAFGPEVTAGVGVAHQASKDLRRAGRAATERALAGLDLRPGHSVLLLFVDPTSGDAAAAIDGAYAVALGRIPLAGGGANGPSPCLLAGDTISRDAVVAVAISSPRPIAVALADGCRPRSAPAIATRTEGRAVRELNGRPAEDVYLEGIKRTGPDLDDDGFERLAVLHPLGQPELRGLLRLRHVTGRAEGGGLACATPIPSNAAVLFTEQTEETIVASAGRAAQEALELLPGPPRAALVFDCAARQRALGPRVHDEVEALLQALGSEPVLCGLYTRGEVARTRGAKGDRNHAVVVVAFA